MLAPAYHLMANKTESIMATFKFYIPAINLMGAGCLQEAAADIKGYGHRKALIVTDKILNQIGVVAKVAGLLAEHGIESAVFDETKRSFRRDQTQPDHDQRGSGLGHAQGQWL